MARKQTLQGGKLMLFVGSSTVDLSTACKLTLTNETSDEATKDDGIWGYDEIVKKSWSATNDGKLNVDDPVANALFTNWLNGTQVTIKIGVPANWTQEGVPAAGWSAPTTKYFTGTAIIESLDLDGTKGSAGTASVTFKGVGALTYTA